jgi:hypothetical protein
MIQPRSLALTAAIAFLTVSNCVADETFPVVHDDPITVRIVGGINGIPLSNLHLVLIGGYDQSDLHDQLYRREVLTDTFGNVRLPKQLANLPWLQVWVNKMPLCQSNPRKTSFSVELIRRDGLNAPNLCGPVSAQETPGIFTVFVKNKAKKLKKGVSITVGLPWNRSPLPAPAPASTAENASPAAPHTAVSEAATSAVVTTVVPMEAPLKDNVIAPAAVPAPVNPPASVSLILPVKTAAHLQPRRVAAKPAVHRAKPAPVACSAQPPAAKAATAPPAKDHSKDAPPRKALVSSASGSKPLAGRRVAAKKPAHPATAQKQE